jgi:hypothetical protein
LKNRIIEPTFRSKISFFTIFAAIDFQFNINLLDIYARITGGYMCIWRPKNDSIQFHQVPFVFQIILIGFKNAIGKNSDFLKNTAECRIEK